MTTFFSTLSIALGLAVAVLNILDWLLSQQQKTQINAWAEHTWLWLTYQRMGRFVRVLTNRKIQFIISIIVAFVCYLLIIFALSSFVVQYVPQETIERLLAIIFVIVFFFIPMFFVSWKIHPKLVSWTVINDSLGSFLWRCFLFVVVSYLVLTILCTLFLALLSILLDTNYFGTSIKLFIAIFLLVIILATVTPLSAELTLVQMMVFTL